MTTAVCPGSFDPITMGHIDIIKRAAALFDRVIVVVMVNYYKTGGCFTAAERVDLIERSVENLPNVSVDMYGGLLAEYVKKVNANAVVKGLRAVSDFEYEFQQALTNKKINPNFETVFLPAQGDNMFLSSSLVKQVAQFGGDISEFLPPPVRNDIIERLRKGKENEY